MPSINLRMTQEQHRLLAQWAASGERSIQKEVIRRLFSGELAAGEVGAATPPAARSSGRSLGSAQGSTESPAPAASSPGFPVFEQEVSGVVLGPEEVQDKTEAYAAAIGSTPVYASPKLAQSYERMKTPEPEPPRAARPDQKGKPRRGAMRSSSPAPGQEKGICEHRVPSGTYCKRCGETVTQ